MQIEWMQKDNLAQHVWLSIGLMLVSLLSGCVAPVEKAGQQTHAAPVALASAPVAVKVPDWFANQNLSQPGFWLGYGSAPTLEQAKLVAHANLKTTLTAQMDATGKGKSALSRTEKQQQAADVAQSLLANLALIKQQSQNELVYVAVGYDYRALSERILYTFKKLETQKAPGLVESSALFKQLNTRLGFMPRLDLGYEQGHYYLTNQQQSLVVKTRELPELLPHVPANSEGALRLTLQPGQTFYAPEQLYSVDVLAKRKGYVSYLQLSELGETNLMFANQSVRANSVTTYPSYQQYEGLITELGASQIQNRVTHLVLLCPTSRDFSVLEGMATGANHSYQSFALGALNTLAKNCEATSVVMTVKR